MTHGSLFSGIGGFDLAAEWMGWENVFHCEWNPFGRKILNHYWPNAISYEDITKTDFSIHRGTIDIFTGGFPCQPYSQAGLRKGKDDERHLWPEMLRAIREIEPTWVVGENVLGLVNWNGGLVFEEIQADLEAEGYEVQPYVLPACGTDAPHRRYRVWFVAYSRGNGYKSRRFGKDRRQAIEGESIGDQRKRLWGDFRRVDEKRNASDTDSARFKKLHISGIADKQRWGNDKAINGGGGYWRNFPTQPPICDGNDGLSSRLDGITFPKWRNESIKAGGNAIVPQVVHQIFKAIELYEQNQRKGT